MVRKKSPRSNDPYAKAKEIINKNETAITTILEQNSEPYLREQSNLYQSVTVDLGTKSLQFCQFIDESNGDRQSYACAANSNRQGMSINNSSAGRSIFDQVDNVRTVQSGDTGNDKNVNLFLSI